MSAALPARRPRLASQEALLAAAVIGLAVVVGFINPRFLAARNLSDLLLGNAYVAIAAIGMSMVIISGNIDISVVALIGAIAAPTVLGSWLERRRTAESNAGPGGSTPGPGGQP